MLTSDAVRLRHVLDAAREAIEFSKGCRREDLDKDRKLGLAMVRLLEVIGEAARGVSREFREAHPDIEWSKMAGMRDRLIHGYYDVNMNVVWETVQGDLPPLVSKLARLVASETEPQ